MMKRPQFTLLVSQSHQFISKYFCSCKVYDATVSILEQKELFFISSLLITLDQQERYLWLFQKAKFHLCVYIPAYCTHLYMEYKVSCTWYANQLVFTLCSVVSVLNQTLFWKPACYSLSLSGDRWIVLRWNLNSGLFLKF
jgi:hypothetical protein